MKKSLADFLLGLQDWEETGMDELSDLIEHMFRLCSQNIEIFLVGNLPQTRCSLYPAD